MPQFNYNTGEIIAKIVYYGPAFGGKTTSLQWLHHKFDPLKTRNLFSLDTEGDRTLFFDLLPMDFGKIDWMTLHVKIYTVPGEVKYNATRKMVLTGADAVIFVADSEIARHQENLNSLKNLAQNLSLKGMNIRTIPLVFQYNKRDLAHVLPLDILDQKLNFRNLPSCGSIAIDPYDFGVLESFIMVLHTMIESFGQKYNLAKLGDLDQIIRKLEEQIREKTGFR